MNKAKNLGIGILVLVLLAVISVSSLFIVHEGEYKVVLQFGEAVRMEETPGMKFKIPFIQSVTSLPKRQMIYDSNPSQIITKDKKPIIVDNYAVWRINDARKFYRTNKSVVTGEQRIEAAVYSTMRRKLSETDYGDIISETSARGDLNASVTQEVANLLNEGEYGIEIVDVRIKRTDLPEQNKESVFNRMISDRKAIAAQYLSEGDEQSQIIKANTDRQAKELIAQAESDAKKIIAQGEQEAAQIYNAAYGKDPQFYKLYRTLESYVTTFQNEPVIMLPIESPYTKILLGN
jgi:membrane protease subunit HflC